MDCSCDYDMPSFHNREMRRARKQYKCYECRGLILEGEKYEYTVGKWDYISTFRTCSRCVAFRVWMSNSLPCFCWGYGDLFENAREAAEAADWRAGEEVKGIRFGVARRIHKIELFNRQRQAEVA